MKKLIIYLIMMMTLLLSCEKEFLDKLVINTIFPVITYYAHGAISAKTYFIKYKDPKVTGTIGEGNYIMNLWKDTSFVGEWKHSIPFDPKYKNYHFEIRTVLSTFDELVDFQIYFLKDANSEEFGIGSYYRQCTSLCFSEANFGYSINWTPLVLLPYISILDETDIRPVFTYYIKTKSVDNYQEIGDTINTYNVEFTDPRFGDEIQTDSFTNGKWIYHIPYEQDEEFKFRISIFSDTLSVKDFHMRVFINDIGSIYGSSGGYDDLGRGSIVDSKGKIWRRVVDASYNYKPDKLFDYYINYKK